MESMPRGTWYNMRVMWVMLGRGRKGKQCKTKKEKEKVGKEEMKGKEEKEKKGTKIKVRVFNG